MSACAPLLIGWSSTSITPDRPVNLAGQFRPRIARQAHDPLTATALALQAGDEQAVLVSCDLVAIRPLVMERLRARVGARLPDLDPGKLVVAATHTHTAPDTSFESRPEAGAPAGDDFMEIFTYRIADEDVMRPQEYVALLVDRLAEVVAQAWEGRRPGAASGALGQAVVGYNRRAVYADGRARMYGDTSAPDFRHIEGYEDHSLDLLFCWDEEGQPTGVAVNVPCPSQVVEGQSFMSADFWHDVRVELRQRFGDRLFVLGLTGASGDQSPHPLFRQTAEATGRRRSGRSENEVIARRIAQAVDEVLDGARGDARAELPFAHRVETLVLPHREITGEEFERARSEHDRLLAKTPAAWTDVEWMFARRWRSVVERFERRGRDAGYPVELHVVRIGELALATNPFELFLDYGLRIKARSPAEQTFLVQLACGTGGYLPTARAVAGGGYGAEAVDGLVGPEGGDRLVERTIEVLEEMWGGRNA